MGHFLPPLKIFGVALTGGLIALAVDPSVVAISIAFVISAIGGAIVLVIKALGENQKAARADAAVAALAATVQLTAIAAQGDVIKTSVDGAAHAAAAKIDGLLAEITFLRGALADKTTVAAVLAQATSTTPRKP